MRKRFLFLLAIALIAVFCGAAAAKDALIVADQYDATTLDPIGHNDMPSSRACYALYDTLVFLEPDGTAKPGLAESWEFLSDTDYKFTLRKGVKFHNGDTMTAEDVRYTIMRATTEAGAQINEYSNNVKDVEIVDDNTVIIHLKKVDYSFFPSLSHSWGSIVSKRAVEEAGENFGMNPVGAGPFKFVSWQKGNKYVLERFDDYWGEKAKVKTLEVRSVPEPTSRTIELESGGVDIAYPIVTNDLKRIEENEKLVLYRRPQTSITYMGFNVSKKPFDDVRVRQALHAALDTVTIQAAVWRGVGKVPTSLVPEAVKYSIAPEVEPHKQDVELAKKLLADAGIKDMKLEIWTNERKERIDMSTIIQAQLEEIGIASEIKVMEWGAYLSGLEDKKHDVYLLGWVSTVPDPNFAVTGLLETNAGSNFTYLSDARVDDLLARGRSVADGDERAAIYKELQLYINEQTPMVYLHNDESIAGTQKNVKDFVPSSNEVHSFREAYFED
ncbi:MAG: ABC transporter substrate-binding protein [Synergistaceae bacterium]|jgi:peptide/nickel transport system substrate-binding protein|nr:ABC transporter substrate-binding protein [Synergistaceae bacterium]